MLLPIGHDQGELRRWPILTFAILAVCIALQLVPLGPSSETTRAADASFEESLKYYVAHPELKPHPLLRSVALRYAARLRGDEGDKLRASIEHPPPASPLTDLRQQSLDRKTEPWVQALDKEPTWQWGYIPNQSNALRLITHMFLHSGFLHLFFNMLFLYIMAPFIEDQWGRPLFFCFYIAAGVVAALGFSWHAGNVSVPLIGASGAIAGVMGAFLVRFPTASIKFMRLFPPGTFHAPAWVFLPLWFGGEILSARMQAIGMPTGGETVAYLAHVYGFAFGVVAGLVMWALKVEERVVQPGIAAQTWSGAPVMGAAQRLLSKGQRVEACNLLEREVVRSPSNLDAVFAYWNLASELGWMPERRALCQRVLTAVLSSGDEENGLELWNTFDAAAPSGAIDIPLAVVLSRVLQHHGQRRTAVEVVESVEDCLRLDTDPDLLVELARQATEMQTRNAEAIVANLLRHPRVPRAAKQRFTSATVAAQGIPAKQAMALGRV